MANPTSNFGWQMPTNTDLVKDLPADFEVFGQAVDTSLMDLKGGTTGQVLSKASNTDMDFTWVAQDDSNAIQNALLTTTGDTIYASGASTPARLGIGTTGQVLTVAGGVPSWATPSSGSMTSIASGSLSGSAVNLTSISGSYKDLILIVRDFRPSVNNNLSLRINNDSTANRYRQIPLNATTTTTLAFNLDNFPITRTQNTSTSDSFVRIEFYDYANTSTWKYVNMDTVVNDDGTSTSLSIRNDKGIYNQTGAITQINLYLSSGTFSEGTYILYGVN